MVDRLLVLASLAAAVAVLVAAGRLLALRRLRRLRVGSPEALWAALGTRPDGRPTVVAFSSPSCGVCRTAQKPALAALERLAGGTLRVVHVDVARSPQTARTFGILTVPATVVLDGRGAVVAANQGFATAERLAAQAGVSEAATPLATLPRNFSAAGPGSGNQLESEAGGDQCSTSHAAVR